MDEITAIQGIDEAMVNSYNVIVGNTTFEEMLHECQGEGIFFAHNVENEPTTHDIKYVKEYFEKLEDFEKCIELKKILGE